MRSYIPLHPRLICVKDRKPGRGSRDEGGRMRPRNLSQNPGGANFMNFALKFRSCNFNRLAGAKYRRKSPSQILGCGPWLDHGSLVIRDFDKLARRAGRDRRPMRRISASPKLFVNYPRVSATTCGIQGQIPRALSSPIRGYPRLCQRTNP
jgi:hypothetical protein